MGLRSMQGPALWPNSVAAAGGDFKVGAIAILKCARKPDAGNQIGISTGYRHATIEK